MKRALLWALVLVACGREEPTPPAAPASPEALRAAWRESIQRRSAWQTLVDNIPSLQQDEARVDRLMAEHNVLMRLPIASEPISDAGQYAQIITRQADRLGLPRFDGIELTPTPAPAPPPREVLASVGIEYAEDQIVGTHALTLKFPDRDVAEKLITGLAELDRRPLLDRLETGPDGSVTIHGRVLFLRDLVPTRIEPDHYDVPAILAAVGGDPAGETAQKLKENYKQIEGLAAPIKEACGLEARLKLKTARYRAFTRLSEELAKKGSWASLVGEAPALPPHPPHPPHPAHPPHP